MSLGVKPAAMVGHSLGEYVAACLAGVFSLEDALDFVAFRGRLIYDLPPGSMLAVPLPAAEIPLTGSLSIAAVNSPEMCVVSGPTAEIEALEQNLATQAVSCRRLFTSHAFHSAMMDPILESFENRRLPAPAHPLSFQSHRNLDQTRRGHRSRLLDASHSPGRPLFRLSRGTLPQSGPHFH
jgi:malonyl CoA-acyl carrier protein transacylase